MRLYLISLDTHFQHLLRSLSGIWRANPDDEREHIVRSRQQLASCQLSTVYIVMFWLLISLWRTRQLLHAGIKTNLANNNPLKPNTMEEFSAPTLHGQLLVTAVFVIEWNSNVPFLLIFLWNEELRVGMTPFHESANPSHNSAGVS